MQLVVRVEKADPPRHTAVCEAAASSVAALLTAPEAVSGDWSEPVRRWESGPIRKVARRARGVRWPAVQGLPGITVAHEGAQVRALVPGPIDQVPAEVARLQVAGLDLREHEAEPDRCEPCTPEPGPLYAAIALNPEVAMSTGKAAAQCGHAAHLLLRRSAGPDVAAWTAAGLPVRLVSGLPWPERVRRSTVTVRDAGFTEVAPGTLTTVAWLVGRSAGSGATVLRAASD